MQTLLLVALGGAAGSVLRYLAGVQATRTFGTGWPYGIFGVNVIGGLLMGLLVGALAFRGGDAQERWRLLLGVGVLGGFTTFSSFSLDVALMIERKAWGQAALYSVSSVLLSVAALFVGLFLMRRIFA